MGLEDCVLDCTGGDWVETGGAMWAEGLGRLSGKEGARGGDNAGGGEIEL